MIFSRAIISFVLILISFEIFALDQKPSVSVFVLDNNRDTRSVKLSITTQLNQAGFVVKDGNIFLKRFLSDIIFISLKNKFIDSSYLDFSIAKLI